MFSSVYSKLVPVNNSSFLELRKSSNSMVAFVMLSRLYNVSLPDAVSALEVEFIDL